MNPLGGARVDGHPAVAEALPRAPSGGVLAPMPALVLAASLALSICVAIRLPLLDPDEGRNSEVAREMSVNHDFVIPHLAGMPYLDKPPAFFWAAALSIRLLGHTPLAARVPSMLASLITLWLIGRAALRSGGQRFAMIAVALLASAPLFAGLSAYVIFDMMLTLCVTVVWLGVAREVEEAGAGAPTPDAAARTARSRRLRRLAMFAAIAAGLLIKGPVMLVWAVCGSLGAALVLRSRAPLRWLAWWPGWIVALGLPGIWFALATLRFPEYPHYAFLEESLERISSGSFHRDQPWWFVPAVLVGGTLPWCIVTPWSRVRWRRASEPVTSAARAGLGFVLFAALFFTLSRSKLVTYLLPAIPPIAWTAAAMWGEAARGRRGLEFRLPVSLGLSVLLMTALLFVGRNDSLARTGAPLARAIAAAGAGSAIYERCYSPGTDYLLGTVSPLVSARGEETASNYIVRYRATLVVRGLWRGLERIPEGFVGVVVHENPRAPDTPVPGPIVFSDDDRFVAYRVTAPPDSTPATRH